MKIEMVGFILGVSLAVAGCVAFFWRKKTAAVAEATSRAQSAEANEVEKRVVTSEAITNQSQADYENAAKAHRSTPPGVPPAKGG